VPARVRHAAPVRSPRRFLQIAIPRRCLGGPWAPNHIAWDREFVREPWRVVRQFQMPATLAAAPGQNAPRTPLGGRGIINTLLTIRRQYVVTAGGRKERKHGTRIDDHPRTV
jgi:hypothetical protein